MQEGMTGQRGGHLGARLRGRVLGRDSAGQAGPLTGRYIQEVDHAAAHVQAEATGFEVFDCGGGRGQKEGEG